MTRPVSPPRVSVVLPARDAAATLGRAIASIRGQTWTDWELLVVDDGSRDETHAIAEAAAREDARVRVIAGSRDGIVAALTVGLAAARGELVARMDADDASHAERLAEQVAFLDAPAHSGIGLVGCLVDFGGDRTTSEGYARHVDWINSLVTPEQIALNRFVESPFAHPSVMFRRTLVARWGGYRAGDFPEDYEMWLRWLDAGVRMAKVPRALLTWNDPPGRLSRTDPRYDDEAFFRMKAQWIARGVAAMNGAVANAAESGRSAGVTAATARRLLVWGAGRPTRKRAVQLERHGVRIAGFVDVDRKKWTPALGGTGVPVIGPAALPGPDEVCVLGYVSSRGARELIRGELNVRGFREGRDFLMCA